MSGRRQAKLTAIRWKSGPGKAVAVRWTIPFNATGCNET